MDSRPDTLVLGSGGVLGEAWMSGVLAGLEQRREIDLRRCDYFVGTSAGAIVAARLSAGLPPRRPEDLPEPPPIAADPASTADDVAVDSGRSLGALVRTALGWTAAISSPWIRMGMSLTAPIGALGRAAALRVIPSGGGTHVELRAQIEEFGARFDGRLRITAVRATNGQRVVFGSPGAPDTTVTGAVEASCSVPSIYAPVTIGEVDYVDGGVWSPTNLDVAPAGRDTQILCLSPTGSLYGPLTPLIRAPSRAITLLEIAALHSRGVDVTLVTPDQASAEAIGPDPMARAPAASVLAAGFLQGLTL